MEVGDKVRTKIKDLTRFGIDRDLSNLNGTILGFYPSGYIEVEYEPDYDVYGKYALPEQYDIPRYHLTLA